MSDRATHGWCPVCLEMVAVSAGGVCLWCGCEETMIRRPRVVALPIALLPIEVVHVDGPNKVPGWANLTWEQKHRRDAQAGREPVEYYGPPIDLGIPNLSEPVTESVGQVVAERHPEQQTGGQMTTDDAPRPVCGSAVIYADALAQGLDERVAKLAYRLYYLGPARTFEDIAAELLERTEFPNATSLGYALVAVWARSGWRFRPETTNL